MPIRGTRRPHVVPITAPSFPTPPQPRMYRKIAYTFIAFTILTVIAVLWLSSVTATIDVYVKKAPIRLDSSAEVARYPRSGQIPGRVVQGVYFKNQLFDIKSTVAAPAGDNTNLSAPSPALIPTSTTTTTSVSQPVVASSAAIARGKVKVINKYSRAQTLVRTTRLLTEDGKLYRINKQVNVPSNGEVEVDVYADKPGSEYAIGPTKFTIPGLFVDLQKHIYAESTESFEIKAENVVASTTAPVVRTTPPPTTRRATSTSDRILTREALDDAYRILTDAVLEQAKRQLAAEISDPNLGEAVYFVKVVEKSSSVLQGQSAENFIATVKLDVTGVFYPKEDMLSIIRNRLREKIPEGREFLPLENGNVVYALESADAKSETAIISIKAEGGYRLTPQSPQLDKGVLAGKTREEVEANIKVLDGVERVEVRLSPNWLSRIPTLKDHIEVNVK